MGSDVMMHVLSPVQSPPKGVTIPYRPKPSGSPVIFAGGQVYTTLQRDTRSNLLIQLTVIWVLMSEGSIFLLNIIYWEILMCDERLNVLQNKSK